MKNDKKILTVNLSSLTLHDSDISLLDRGLTFTPTMKTLPLRTALENKDRLIRNIKLRSFFNNKGSNSLSPKIKPFQQKSTWTPKTALLTKATLDTVTRIENNTVALIKKANKITRNNEIFIKLKDQSNLSMKEFESLNKLRKNQDIVIKSADKGGATVITDIQNYMFEAERQLNDANYYRILDSPIFLDNKPRIVDILSQMQKQGFINNKQFKYLSGPEDPRHRIFYLLPKIHKDRRKWTIADKMPEGRPIVSDVESESYRISQLLEQFLTPFHET